MNKRILISLLITLSIISIGCSNKKVESNSNKQNSSTSSQITNTDLSSTPDVEDKSSTSGETNTVKETDNTNSNNKDYTVYSGNWATEIDVKDDYLYGIGLSLTIDKEGNIKAQVGDATENLTHIANVAIKGKIDNGKFVGKFEEDGWNHNGTINLDFSENTITLTIKYGEGSSKNNLWGVGEGTFTLIKRDTNVNRTLNNLIDGGLQVIQNQSFSVKLENYGDSKFISGLKRENASNIACFYILDNNNNLLYKLPDFYGNSKGKFIKLDAVSFMDANNDGLKDIIIVGEFEDAGKSKTVSSIYFQKSKEFLNDDSFDEKLNKSNSNKDIASIIKFAKSNLK